MAPAKESGRVTQRKEYGPPCRTHQGRVTHLMETQGESSWEGWVESPAGTGHIPGA